MPSQLAPPPKLSFQASIENMTWLSLFFSSFFLSFSILFCPFLFFFCVSADLDGIHRGMLLAVTATKLSLYYYFLTAS